MKGISPRIWKRVRRITLYLSGGVSLLVLVASLATWAWLGRYEGSVVCVRPTWQLTIGAFPRAIIIDRRIVTWPLHPDWEINRGNFGITTDFDLGDETGRQVSLHQAGGAAFRTITRTYASKSGKGPYVSRELDIWVPYWLLALVAAPLPLYLAIRRRAEVVRARRLARGQCQRCGYDLRATPGRCPECGTVARRTSIWARLCVYASDNLRPQKLGLVDQVVDSVA